MFHRLAAIVIATLIVSSAHQLVRAAQGSQKAMQVQQNNADLQKRFQEGERNIKRLPPSAFPNLPSEIKNQLEKRDCTIPQTEEPRAHNVIKGQFAKMGQIDWAVLCSKDAKSSLLIFWGGPTKCANDADRSWWEGEDRDWQQTTGDNTIGYSWMIDVVNPKYIVRQHKRYDVALPVKPIHQAINSIFVGKASVVLYCHKGNWLRLQGAD